jgi:hypothetical protein
MSRRRDFGLKVLKEEAIQCDNIIINLQEIWFQFEDCFEMIQDRVNGGLLLSLE